MQAARELFAIPSTCPACGGSTVEDGDFLFCRSKSCPSRLSGALKVWIGRLGLLHWGDALVEALTESDPPRISSVADIYRMSAEDLAPFCSGMKMAKKLLDVLHSNKTVTLELLLCGQNIPNLGMSTSTDIVHAGFDTVEKVLAMSHEDLVRVPNIGDVTARTVLEGLSEKAPIIRDLATVLDVKKPVSGVLSGKSVCVTGTTKVPRKAIQKAVLDAGGVAKDSVGAGLTYLVTNEGQEFASAKMQKAKKYGTTILTEDQLFALIGS